MSESACVKTSSTCATETKVGSPLGGGQGHTSGKVQACANVSNLLIGVTPPLCDVTERKSLWGRRRGRMHCEYDVNMCTTSEGY